MTQRSKNVLAAAITTALCFAACIGSGFLAAVDDNLLAGFISFVFMVLTLGSDIWCIAASFIQRSRCIEPRGFPVLTREQGYSAPVGDDHRDTPPA